MHAHVVSSEWRRMNLSVVMIWAVCSQISDMHAFAWRGMYWSGVGECPLDSEPRPCRYRSTRTINVRLSPLNIYTLSIDTYPFIVLQVAQTEIKIQKIQSVGELADTTSKV